MSGPIAPISAPPLLDSIQPAGSPATGTGAAFQDVFSAAIKSVEGSAQDASASVERFLSGEGEDVHTTVLAAERAELSFDLFLQARNKVVSAYQEIMRLQM
jgi:flagellar hook-basal body complex protein FliE